MLLKVNDLINKNPGISVEEKNIYIELWVDDVFNQTGKNPSNYELTRLADWLLQDDLSNPSRSKVQNTEYPILSKPQLERRYRELSKEQDMVDLLHRRKQISQSTRKRDAKHNEY